MIAFVFHIIYLKHNERKSNAMEGFHKSICILIIRENYNI